MKTVVSAIRNPKTNTLHVQGKYCGYTKCGLLVRHPVFIYDTPLEAVTCNRCNHKSKED